MTWTPLPSDAPFGAKVVDFSRRAFRSTALVVLVLVLVAGAFASLRPRRHVDRAIVEIGTRFVEEPLVHPVGTALRLHALCQRVADQRSSEALIEVRIRRDEKTNAVTRIMDVSVEAETASAARSILDRALAQYLREHRGPTEYEHQLHTRELKDLERAAQRLETALAEVTGEERSAYETRLYETRRMLDGVSDLVARGSLPTRVVSRASQPEPRGSKLTIFLAAAVVLGLLLGASFTAVRLELTRIAQGMASTSSDPALRELLAITARYRLWLILGAVIGGGAGLALGARAPGQVKVGAVVEVGVVAPNEPVEDLDSTASALEAYVTGRVLADELPEGTELETMVVRDQPPPATKQPLIMLTGLGPTVDSAKAAIEKAVARLSEGQTPPVEAERARLHRLVTGLDEALARLDQLPETLENHTTKTKSVVDRTDYQRRLSEVRLHPPRLVVEPRAEPPPVAARLGGFGFAFFLLGLLGAYLAAFFHAGAGYLRSMGTKRPE